MTPQSVLLWYAGAALPFDVAQLACTGTWRLSLAAGNLAGSTVLFLACGLVWSLDLSKPRHLLPAGGAVTISFACLAAWTWP